VLKPTKREMVVTIAVLSVLIALTYLIKFGSNISAADGSAKYVVTRAPVDDIVTLHTEKQFIYTTRLLGGAVVTVAVIALLARRQRN